VSIQERIVELAKQWAAVGVPYRHHLVTRRGCDCTGLLVGILNELGFGLDYELPVYSKSWNMHGSATDRIRDELIKIASAIGKDRTALGDIVLFVYKGQIYASHTGIMVGQDLFIHCHIDAGRVRYGRLIRSAWANRWSETWRIDLEKLRQFK
jgi:cell wall-associated NlpC family hydrolase